MKHIMFLAVQVALAQACWGRTPLGPGEEGRLQKAPVVLHKSATNSGQANQWAGRTTLNSGSAFNTVSTRMIKADSHISGQWIPNATVSSGQQWSTPAVMSIVAGVSFAVGNVDGVGRAPGGTFCWEIKRET